MSAISNARWILLSQVTRVLTQLIGLAVLARLLPAESYGVMALAVIVTNLAALFRDLGSSAAIIQAETLTHSLKSTVHWANVALGLLIGLAVAVSAPVMSAIFHEPDLKTILLMLSFVFPISGVGIVHQALLERDSHFSTVVAAEVGASVAGLAVALLAATFGAGVYSLVLQVFVSALTATVIIVGRSTFRPSWQWNRVDFKSIVGFSGNLSLFNLINYFARNADSMIVGKVLGTALLGVYSVSYRIMLLPVQNLTFVATRALFPILSRKNDRLSELADLYLKSVGLIAFVSAPMMAGLFAVRILFVDVVLGAKWHTTAALLAWLAPVGFIQSIVSTAGTILMARGRADLMLRLGLFSTVLQISAFLIGSHWGIRGVAACYFFANVVNAFPALHFSGRLIGISAGLVVRQVAPCIALSLVMAGILLLAQAPLAALLPDKRVQLVLLTVLGGSIYSTAALWLLRGQVSSLKSFAASRRRPFSTHIEG